MSSAREAALEALQRCRRSGAWSAAAMDAAIKKYGLDGRDSALASRLFMGVLQNLDYCDYYVNYYHSGGAANMEPKLRDILRLGVCQLLFLDKIPARAAVNESVALCKQGGLSRAAGLVNAVLRRVSENRENLPEIPGKGTAQYLSTRYSHPLWLAERLIKERGYDFTEGFFAANNRPAGLTIQVNTLKVTESDYIRALERADIPYRRFEAVPGCLELEGGSVLRLPGYEEGLFYVQDRAARMAVQAADPKPGMKVLDACAAPGGKSFAAAIAMENRGDILSCDIHEKKLALIDSGAKRLGVDIITTACRDARTADETMNGAFDLVLCDVPCSGFGLLGKRPEIRRKQEAEIASLPAIQEAILENASRFVRPGGTLLYSTCTVLRRENEDVVCRFLEKNGDFYPVDFAIGDVRSEDGMHTFWPHVNGTDGFFAAKLQRRDL